MTLSPADQVRALRDEAAVARLPRGVIEVAGPDAERFLQNLVSQDIGGMEVGTARRALLLTPKARIIADPRVTRVADDVYLLDLEPDAAQPLAAALTRYRLGAKATIEDVGDRWALVAVVGPAAMALDGLVLDAPLGAVPRHDVLVPAADADAAMDAAVAAGAVPVDADALEAVRIEQGVPRLGHDVDERWMPAEVGLVEVAVSFDKGCFIGQEPVTRLHRRGHANRGPRRLIADGPLEVGAALLDGEREVGVVTSAAGPPWLDRHVGIGIVRVDVDDDATLTAGPAAVRLG